MSPRGGGRGRDRRAVLARSLRVGSSSSSSLEEDEVREWLGASGRLGRPVAREVVERGREDGADVQLAREVDDVDRRGYLVPRVVVAVGGERHPFAPVPVGKGDGEVALKTLQALAPWDTDKIFAGHAENGCEEGKVLNKWPAKVSIGARANGGQSISFR